MRSLAILALCSAAAVGAQDVPLDSFARKGIIETAILRLEQYYVYPRVAEQMATAVRAKLKAGEYDNTVDARFFAEQLTRDLRAVSKDGHLDVMFRGASDGPQMARSIARPGAASGAAGDKCGFVRSEVQEGNVGYLKFDLFLHPDECASAATAAMTKLADTDALIIDLRDNSGGRPEMTSYITSYLLDKRTHLTDIYSRYDNSTGEVWTRDVPGRKYGGTKPLYVLTSKRTFSGAEEFSYNLKNLKRATIVGESTGGGAHPTMLVAIDNRFVILVPFARPISPITKTDWEGTGVVPHVRVPESKALETARRMIAERAKVQIPR